MTAKVIEVIESFVFFGYMVYIVNDQQFHGGMK